MKTPLEFLKTELATLRFVSSGRLMTRTKREAKEMIPLYEQAVDLLSQSRDTVSDPKEEGKGAEDFLKKKYKSEFISPDVQFSKRLLIENMEEFASLPAKQSVTDEDIEEEASFQVSRYMKARNNPTMDLFKRFKNIAKWARDGQIPKK